MSETKRNMNENDLYRLAASCRLLLTETECGLLKDDLNGLFLLADRLLCVESNQGTKSVRGAVCTSCVMERVS